MGRVAAAHALSDLYACGAEPLTALAVTLMQKAPPELVRRCCTALAVLIPFWCRCQCLEGIPAIVAARCLRPCRLCYRYMRGLAGSSFFGATVFRALVWAAFSLFAVAASKQFAAVFMRGKQCLLF